MVTESPIAGVDGCKQGWVYVLKRGIEIQAGVSRDFTTLLDDLADARLICIDIPIGFPNHGPRECDREARRLLGWPRRNSVFSPPVRPIVEHSQRRFRPLCDSHRQLDGRGLSQQCCGILPKIRQVDEALRANPTIQGRLREVHPEVCFLKWNRGVAMQHNKKTVDGKHERELLIARAWPGHRQRLKEALSRAADDLNDAFAALWTASRVLTDCARPISSPITDARSIDMAIWV